MIYVASGGFIILIFYQSLTGLLRVALKAGVFLRELVFLEQIIDTQVKMNIFCL
jgi:hypothetical protein